MNVMADFRVSKGKLIDFTNSDYQLTGVYLITSTNHTVDEKKETVQVTFIKRNV